MAYTNQETIEAYLGRSLTDPETIMLSFLLASIDTVIDNTTHQTFTSDGPATRTYDGGDYPPLSDVSPTYEVVRIIQLDPCRDVTAVTRTDSTGEITYTYIEGQDYILGPQNQDLKTYIEKRYWPFYPGTGNISVTATFSFSDTVPPDIQYVATYLAAQMITSGGYIGSDVSGPVTLEMIEGYRREYESSSSSQVTVDGFAQKILDNYGTQDEVLL